jgi:outer membrane lipoprotein carrier protein
MHRWIVVLLVSAAWTAGAPAQTAQEVLEHMRERYDDVRDLRLAFTQRTTVARARIDQRSNGTLLLKKEHMYRVELDQQTIVTDGETVWSYSAPTRQVLIDRFKPGEGMLTPERILTGAPEDYRCDMTGREQIGDHDTVVLKLTPRSDNAAVQSLRLWVDTGDWIIRKAEVIDGGGTVTVYTVSDVRINTGVDDARFTYQIPEGVEVVDLR